MYVLFMLCNIVCFNSYRQKEQAAEIHKIAETAVNLSTQAYDIAKDAINRQKNIR